MRGLKITTQFKKDLKKAKKQGRNIDLLGSLIKSLQQGHELDEKYQDHYLGGNWKDHRECHIAPNWLLIYKTTDSEIRLARVGSHAELFG